MPGEKDSIVNALARQGGFARARTLTPEERRESAKKAANARWERYREETGGFHTLTAYCEPSDVADRIIRQVDMDAFNEVMGRVQQHSVSAACPCDDCVDAVVGELRQRYLAILAKIDAAEPLGKDERLLFKILTGERADRWTRVYRQERKSSHEQRSNATGNSGVSE